MPYYGQDDWEMWDHITLKSSIARLIDVVNQYGTDGSRYPNKSNNYSYAILKWDEVEAIRKILLHLQERGIDGLPEAT